MEHQTYVLHDKYYHFNPDAKITKRYIGEHFAMLVILRNRTVQNFLNTEIQFSFKDNESRDHKILRRVHLNSFTTSNLVYFPTFIYLTSNDYLLEIVNKFRLIDKTKDGESVNLDVICQKQFKLSPKDAITCDIKYQNIDYGKDQETLVQLRLTNKVDFPIKILNVDYEDSDSYMLNRIHPDPKQITMQKDDKYNVVLGCIIDPAKKDQIVIDTNNIGTIMVIWQPIGDKSDGGELEYV